MRHASRSCRSYSIDENVTSVLLLYVFVILCPARFRNSKSSCARACLLALWHLRFGWAHVRDVGLMLVGPCLSFKVAFSSTDRAIASSNHESAQRLPGGPAAMTSRLSRDCSAAAPVTYQTAGERLEIQHFGLR